MISRSHRFHGRGSLKYVYKNGKALRSRHVSLRFVTNNRRREYRLAVIVSRKVHKSAVVRNRIRRRIYEIARLYLAQGTPAPVDMVITAFSAELASMPAPELDELITSLLKGSLDTVATAPA